MTRHSFLDQSLFNDLAEKAAGNPRGRQHHNLHQMEEPCHRMVVGLQPSTYVRRTGTWVVTRLKPCWYSRVRLGS